MERGAPQAGQRCCTTDMTWASMNDCREMGGHQTLPLYRLNNLDIKRESIPLCPRRNLNIKIIIACHRQIPGPLFAVTGTPHEIAVAIANCHTLGIAMIGA